MIKVIPEKLDFYKELHVHPCEGVNNKLKECKIQNYSIFYRDGYLFSYLEYTGNDWEENMKKLAAEAIKLRKLILLINYEYPLMTFLFNCQDLKSLMITLYKLSRKGPAILKSCKILNWILL